MSPLGLVEIAEIVPHGDGEIDNRGPILRLRTSTCILAQNGSMGTLSQQAPILPVGRIIPGQKMFSDNDQEVNWVS